MIQRGYLNIEGEAAGEPPGGIGELKWMVLSTFMGVPQPLVVERVARCLYGVNKLPAAAVAKSTATIKATTLASRSAPHLVTFPLAFRSLGRYLTCPVPHCAAWGFYNTLNGAG